MREVLCCCCGILLLAVLSDASTGGAAVERKNASNALRGMEGVCPERFVINGRAPENRPLLMAKKKKKKKKYSSTYGGSSGATVHIDPNTATQKELMLLPLIDAATAQAIIDNRPYKKPEDLVKVPGVGPRKFYIMKHLVEIRGGD